MAKVKLTSTKLLRESVRRITQVTEDAIREAVIAAQKEKKRKRQS